MIHLGVDVGGTFTDLVLFDSDGQVRYRKVPNTRSDRAASTLDGIRSMAEDLALSTTDLANIRHTHGNTIGVNTLIERTGAALGMLVTRGFRDLLELGRLATPDPTRYDSRRPRPLIERERILEVGGRLDSYGHELEELDEQEALEAAGRLVQSGVHGIVVCFLHSYVNSDHELRATELIRASHPDLPVQTSSRLWPQAREYERGLMATINSYVRPNLVTYLDSLASGLAALGMSAEPMVTRSNGGMQRARSVREAPVSTLLSGPAAGVAAAATISATVGGKATSVTLDVGGTSADVGIVSRGTAVLSSDEHVASFPLLLPVTAVSSIGAGGGSVIWLDDVGALKVGPRSAGAEPGPACYGRGGLLPTLTDAFLLSGWLADGQRLGDTIALDRARARSAFEPVARRLDCAVEEAAAGAISVTSAMLAAEVTNVVSKRGFDPLDSNIIAFGGAGPLIASSFAAEAFISEIIVPARPGVLSAEGAAHAHIEGDFIGPVYQNLDLLTADELRATYHTLRSRGAEWLDQENEGRAILDRQFRYSAELRYLGQGYDVTVELSPPWLDDGDLAAIAGAFHEEHENLFGYSDSRAEVTLRELRIHMVGLVQPPRATAWPGGTTVAAQGRRRIQVAGGWQDATRFARSTLPAGARVPGPALLEQPDTTTVVPAGWSATVHEHGSVVLTADEPRENGARA